MSTQHHQRNHLSELEAEAISIIWESLENSKNPAILFSGGKDSITLAHLVKKALYPKKPELPLLHIDTGHNFQETLDFRDAFAQEHSFPLIIECVEESIKRGTVKEPTGEIPSRNALQSVTLLEAIQKYELDLCFGGARRDEEKARSKERVFSLRNSKGEWAPDNQRPEFWNNYNVLKNEGENFRVFPLSNWTELNVWKYIKAESIQLPSLYFSHNRQTIKRGTTLYSHCKYIPLKKGETPVQRTVRFRTVGDMTCTGAIESKAREIDEIIQEISLSQTTERGNRTDDQQSDTAMEDRKRRGYF